MAQSKHDSEYAGDGDEPNERTALLQAEQRTGHETNTSATRQVASDDSDPEGDLLLVRTSSWTSDNPASLAPGPLRPMAPVLIAKGQGEDDEDVEANSPVSSGGTGSSVANGNDDDDGGEPPSFLIDTHPAQFRIAFIGIMMTYFIANFDGTIMATSHPAITSYFNSSNEASWLTTSFLLTSTAFQPLVGRLSDTIGRKPLYLFTMVVFAGATAWCALAQSMNSFIAARAVCGLGAGGMMTLGAISISDCVPIEYVFPSCFLNVFPAPIIPVIRRPLATFFSGVTRHRYR